MKPKNRIFLTQIDHVMHKLRHQFLNLGYANQIRPMDLHIQGARIDDVICASFVPSFMAN